MSPITIQIFRNAPILKISGTFHLSQSREFTELIRYFINSGRTIIILDLTETDDLQSAGLAALASACNQLEAKGGRLVAVAPGVKAAQWHLDKGHMPGHIIMVETMNVAMEQVKNLNGEANGQ